MTEEGNELSFLQKIYNTAPLEFALETRNANDEAVFITNSRKKFHRTDFEDHQLLSKDSYERTYDEQTDQTTKYESHGELYTYEYDSSTTPVSGPEWLDKYDRYKSCLSSASIKSLTGKYACAVVALTEVAYQEGYLYNNSIASTFNYLWYFSKTYVDHTDYEGDDLITFGATYRSNLGAAMFRYLTQLSGLDFSSSNFVL